VQRGIRAKILELYPSLTPFIDELLPKKTPVVVAKWFVLPCRLFWQLPDENKLLARIGSIW
jgi:PUA domain protein